MPFFLGLVCYLTAAVALVGAGLFGLAVLFSPPAPSDLALRDSKHTSQLPADKANLDPGEHRLSDTPQTDREFRYGPKVDHAQGSKAVNYSRQALEEAGSAMAQEQAVSPRKRVREHRQSEIIPPETPTARFEYPPERPSGH